MKRTYVEAFLKYGEKNIDREWLIIAYIVSAIIFSAGTFFSRHKMINIVLCVLVIVSLITIFICSFSAPLKKAKANLYYGIGLLYIMVSCMYLSYHLIMQYWHHPVLLFLILFLATGIGLFFMTLSFLKKIKYGKYLNKRNANPISAAIICIFAILGVAASQGIRESGTTELYFPLIGSSFAIIGFLLTSSVWFLMKYYYYKKIEELDK